MLVFMSVCNMVLSVNSHVCKSALIRGSVPFNVLIVCLEDICNSNEDNYYGNFYETASHFMAH